jgi:hypothetical protein
VGILTSPAEAPGGDTRGTTTPASDATTPASGLSAIAFVEAARAAGIILKYLRPNNTAKA